MKASMYFNYTSRSLLRGGQRTVLAIFCVAVGVMAIVALQLVGQMINGALTGNVRDANGGDIAVTSESAPFKQSDLSFFDQLKSNGTVSNYTPIFSTNGSNGFAASITQSFQLLVVNPNSYPVVDAPSFNAPSNGSIPTLLQNNQVIVDQALADQYNKKVGDTMTLHVNGRQGGLTLPVKIAGIVQDNGSLAQNNDVMIISATDYAAATPNTPLLYSSIDITTNDQAHTDQAVKAIHQKFPVATTQTATDALKSNQQQVDFIKKFLEIAGLLALLIGGVGIINTMQVLLSRRRIEIAMLKTTGYRRVDLYLLFGLEAALLGLIGGVVGAVAAIGVSALIRILVENLFPVVIPFVLDPVIIGGGVLIGLVTALIFGLMPIVQAANIRPLNVIRELPEGNRVGSFFLAIGMLLILSVLFCLLAIFILNDVGLGIGAVYGTFIFLGILSLFFGLVVFLISILPVPERFNPGYLALVIGGLVISALLFLPLPAFGGLLFVVSLMGLVIVLLPRTLKSSTKLALRNIGRQRARTTTTMLALFVGVFTIGLILVLGQDLRDKINGALANSLNYNVITIAAGSEASNLQAKLNTIPGLDTAHSVQRAYSQVVPVAIDGTPIISLLPKGNDQGGPGNLGRSGTFGLLGTMEGYDVANNQLPDTQNNITIADGRNLNASDVGQNHVLLSYFLTQLAPLKGHIHLGSTVTFASLDGKTTQTATVVGFYKSGGFNINFGSVFATKDTVVSLSPAGNVTDIFYMKIDPAKIGKALNAIGTITPNASVINLANIGDFINQILNDFLLILITIASLSLLAGVIIIANAVALAMLERRRELGILKSVGYTSRTVLSEVLIENGVIGGTGALLAMLLVTLATSLLGTFFFKTAFGVSTFIALGLIIGIALLAMVVAALVAWGAVRVRPLEVLRYE
jgi:putative ABC transport system permease protein